MGFPEKPRISGLVNNCAINCSLPTLLQQIDAYATLEVTGKLPDALTDPWRRSYDVLKDTFANEYNLSFMQKQYFSWTVFSEFLNSYEGNFTAVELLFIPVLRRVLKIFSEENGSRLPELQNVEIQANGRFPFLDYYDVQEHFNPRFRINGVVHQFDSDTGTYHSVIRSSGEARVPSSFKELHVYLKDYHYELAEDRNLAAASAQFNQNYERLPGELRAVYDAISQGYCAYDTNQALGHLLLYGQRELGVFISRSKRISDEQRADLLKQAQPRAAQYVAFQQLHFAQKSAAEKVTIATILLTLLENEKVPHAKLLLNKIRIAGSAKVAVKLAEAVFKSWDNLTCVEISELIKSIEEPASNFYFNCMMAFAVAGAGLLVAAMLLNPTLPMIVTVGMGIFGAASLLVAVGMFVVRPLVQPEPADVPRPTFT